MRRARTVVTANVILLFGAASVALGLGYLSAAGAPRGYLLVNAAALALGVAFATAMRFFPPPNRAAVGAITTAVGLLLLATAFLGVRVADASRWIVASGLSLQPSLILLPFAMVHFARRPGMFSSLGLAIAGVALGVQPDRAMAGALSAGLVALWIVRRERPVAVAALAALAGFAAACIRPDTVRPAPFVEQVLESSFAFHPLAGLAVVAGLISMLAPALIGVLAREADRDGFLVFGTAWLAIVVFAVLGPYPTPLVGHGSSAILGYCLSAAALGNFLRCPSSKPV